MIGLDRLMKIKGVVAAGQFSADGSLRRKVGKLPEEHMKQIAALCQAEGVRAEEWFQSFHGESEIDWMPYVGSAVWGGAYAMVTMGCTFIVIEAKYADVNELMVDLLDCEPTGPRQMNQ